MSVRKRTWKTARGEKKHVFVVDYFDGGGKRRHESFATQAEARRRHAQLVLDVSKGAVPTGRRTTINVAAQKWFDHLRDEDRERATLAQYDAHLRLHILPTMGRKRLSDINEDVVQAFRKHLLDSGRSRAMATALETGH